ncbi:MAG: XRE family transcriptional regulator [Gammaproteobacteria bacterium]
MTPDESADAERLRTIWQQARRAHVISSQEEMASRCGWTQGAFSQYLVGRVPLNLDAALKIARELRVQVADISPRLAAKLPASTEPKRPAKPSADDDSRVVSIPVLANSVSMGPGDDQLDHDAVVNRLTLSQEWLHQRLPTVTSTEALRVLSAYGDSMSPTFSDGDLLLVDTGIGAVKIDGVYVLRTNGRLFVKRVRQRIDGTFEISSDNPTVKTVDELSGKHEVSVLGRVVWAWNGRRL